jgi:Fe-S-cluster containining protein
MEVISFLQAVAKDMEDNIFNYTADGKCLQCGNCCSNLLPMSRKEVDAIHKYIRKNNIRECKHLIPVAKKTYDLTCPFRDNTHKCCTIYPVRPKICREFICDSEKRARNNRELYKQTREVVCEREEFFGGN